MRLLRLFCVSFLFLCPSIYLYAEQKPLLLKFEHISGSEELPDPIWCVLVDQRGYLWVGTPVGLFIYDGKGFQRFHHSNPAFNPNDGYFQLLEDKDGAIWFIANKAKTFRYNPRNNQLDVFTDTHDSFSAIKSTGWRLYEDSKGRIWVSSRNWFSFYSKKDQRFYGFPWSKQENNPLVTSFYERPDGNMWIGGQGKLMLFDPVKKTVIQEWLDDDLPYAGIRCLIEGPSEKLWIGTTNGLYTYDIKLKRFYSHKDDSFPGHFNGDTVTVSYLSNQGDIYFGSYSKGIAKYSPKQEKWTLYPVFQKGLQAPNTRCFTEYNGKIFLGALDGIYTLLLENTSTKHYIPSFHPSFSKQADYLTWLFPVGNSLIAGSYISGIYQFSHNSTEDSKVLQPSINSIASIRSNVPEHIWVSGTDGLEHIHYPTGKSTPITDFPNVWAFALDHWRDELLIGTIGAGVYSWNYKTETLQQKWTVSNEPEKGLPFNFCHSLKADGTRVWIGTGISMTCYQSKNNKFKNYFEAYRNDQLVPTQTIFTIAKDALGSIWAGCSWGLIYYDSTADCFRELPLPEGDQIVYAIQSDHNNKLWVATSNNVFQINPETKSVTHLQEGKQFAPSFHRFTRSCIDHSGKVYFSGRNGYYQIDPNVFKEINIKKPYYISAFYSKNLQTAFSNRSFTVLPQDTTIKIPWESSGFKLSLSAPQTQGQYFLNYKLDGFDRDFKTRNALNTDIEYTHIPSGKYTFIAKVDDHKTVTLPITILSPWWRSWSFRTFLFLVILIILYLLFQWRTRSLRKQAQTLEKLVQKKTKDLQIALSDLASEVDQRKRHEIHLEENLIIQDHLIQEVNHRVKNNLSSILSLVNEGEDAVKNDSKAQGFIETLASRIHALAMVHNLLSNSKWQPILLCDLIKNILELSLRNIPHDYIEYCVTPAPCKVSSSQAQHLGLIISELVTNTLKHVSDKQETKIDVSINCNENKVILRYQDNGPGYPEELLNNYKNRDGGGVFLVYMLTSHSLRGKVEYKNDSGATCLIEFFQEHQANRHPYLNTK